MKSNKTATSISGDQQYQEQILPGVSRTFALTIPQLPPALRHVVTNAYLLCRIADTIEDESNLTPSQKRQFHELFIRVVAGEATSDEFVIRLTPFLSHKTSSDERALIQNTHRVVRVTHDFRMTTRNILRHRVNIMCCGMPKFQHKQQRHGLRDLEALDKYCYCVAGVVGELLTDLFCDYSSNIAVHQRELNRLAISFGQGLQMTNILKDIWDDLERGACWLPRDLFSQVGYDLTRLAADYERDKFADGMNRLIGIAHAHLRNALSYTLLIPAHETGIRRFCLWSLGLAMLTLRRIESNPQFSSRQQVKVSRRVLRTVILVTKLTARSDLTLKVLFQLISRRLPLVNGGYEIIKPHKRAVNAAPSS